MSCYKKYRRKEKKADALSRPNYLTGYVSGSYSFNNIVGSAEGRWSFIQNVVDYLRRWNFDGLDVDWEYPGLPERGTTAETKEQFNEFMKVMPCASKVVASYSVLQMADQ